jgi:hypothetical protein
MGGLIALPGKSMKEMTLRWKMILPLILCVSIGVVATVFITGYSAEKVVRLFVAASG